DRVARPRLADRRVRPPGAVRVQLVRDDRVSPCAARPVPVARAALGSVVALLTAVLSHLDAVAVHTHLEYMRDLAPESRFVVCYGGSREEFDRLDSGDALFIDDPSLRVPHHERSYVGLFRTLYEERVRSDPTIELVLLIEYDQLILSGDFERRLIELADRSDAGLFAKTAGLRN